MTTGFALTTCWSPNNHQWPQNPALCGVFCFGTVFADRIEARLDLKKRGRRNDIITQKGQLYWREHESQSHLHLGEHTNCDRVAALCWDSIHGDIVFAHNQE